VAQSARERQVQRAELDQNRSKLKETLYLLLAQGGYAKNARPSAARHPATIKEAPQQHRSYGPSNVVTALGPIHATEGELPALLAERGDVKPALFKPVLSSRCQRKALVPRLDNLVSF
jgi:hypothetical protein